MINIKNIWSVLSIGAVAGFVLGFANTVYYIVAHQYLQHKMFKLIIFAFQKYLDMWVLSAALLSLSGSAAVLLCTRYLGNALTGEKIKSVFRHFKKRYLVLAFIIFLGILNIYIVMDIELLLLLSLSGSAGILLFARFSGPAAIGLKRISILSPSKTRQINKIAVILVIFLGALNLYIIIDGKVNLPSGPNIIMIYLDALRSDHLGCYGYTRDTSPNIDYVANTGAMFKNAFSQAPATYPSVHSGLTSKYACYHFSNTKKVLLEKRHLTLAEVLKNSGYHTVGISSSPVVKKTESRYSLGGFEQGFDLFDDSVGQAEEWNWQWRSPEGVIDTALAWLNKNDPRKFFLFLYIMDPHDDYHCPEPFNSLYDPAYAGKKYIEKGHPTFYEKRINKGWQTFLNQRDIQHLVALYDGEIKYADAQIGKLLSRLQKNDLLSNTLLVLTSDHGEEFFEHGGLKHGNTLYNEQINIPVIMRYPKIIPEGEVLGDALVQAIDIAPTILDLSGIAKPEAMQGQSLLPLIQKKDIFWRDYAISEAPFVDAKTIITKKWKYIHHFESNLINADLCDKYKKGQELYNRQEDPEELHNLFADKPEVAQKLYTRLLSLMPDFEAQRIKAKKNLELTRQTKERLKSIGYLQ